MALGELKCPICGKLLTSNEYGHASDEIKKRIAEDYKKETEQDKREYEENFQKLIEKHQTEIHQERLIQEKLQASYYKQLENLSKSYDELCRQRQKDFDKSLEQTRGEYEEKLYTKDRQLYELQNNQDDFEAKALEEAKISVEDEIKREREKVREKELQLKRLEDEIDKLRMQLSQTPSELKGEVGELDLLVTLRNAFQQDHIDRTPRGTAGSDIIQKIRTLSGTVLETSIVYDNKNAAVVTQHDVKKARDYMEIHGTDYVIIVASNLPKRDVKNGLYGEKDGVLLVHPSIVVEVANQIRNMVIKISKLSAGKQDQETKQSRIYDYVKSREFCTQIEMIYTVHTLMSKLQDDEEKDHEKFWKKRRKLVDQLRKGHLDISSEIDAIIQWQSETKEKTTVQVMKIEDVSNGNGKGEDYSLNNY